VSLRAGTDCADEEYWDPEAPLLPEPSIDDVTDPGAPSRPRQPSPTPVSHIGASARTVSPRLGPGGIQTSSGPRRWMAIAGISVAVLVVAGGLLALVVLFANDELGSWASSPEQGSVSPLEPVELDPSGE